MRPEDFKRWRKSLDLSQKEAAEALGLKRRVVQYYEKGERDGGKVVIPKTVRLACFALSQGVNEYKGPSKSEMQEMRAAAKDKQPLDAEKENAEKKDGDKKKKKRKLEVDT